MYSDADAASLYDVLNPWAPTDDFYLSHIMSADSVLDVGCGTGLLLHRARETGHTGRLCGLDPDLAALDRARRRDDIDWVQGRAADAIWMHEFDLAIMAGNAFQCLVTDDDLHTSLTAIRTALTDSSRFVFSTRNPKVKAWERWNGSRDVIDHNGRPLRVTHHVESVAGDLVTFTETTATRDDEPLRVDRSTLRFLDAPAIESFLAQADMRVEAWFGDWARGPLTDTSPTIVVIAGTTKP